jgi:hypothetical protein
MGREKLLGRLFEGDAARHLEPLACLCGLAGGNGVLPRFHQRTGPGGLLTGRGYPMANTSLRQDMLEVVSTAKKGQDSGAGIRRR